VKVLYVDHTSLVSGAQRALMDLIEGLPDTVTPILMCPEGQLADMARASGVRVIEFPGTAGSLRLHPWHTLRTLGEILHSARILARVANEVGAAVIHANSIRAGLIAGCARTMTKVPIVVHIHDALPATRSANVVRAVISRTADAIVTISDYTTRNFTGEAAKPGVHMLFNPMDIDRFDPRDMSRERAREILGLPADAELVGLAAQITPWKGQDVAIRALHKLRERRPHAQLLLVGEAKFVSKATRYDNLGYERSLHALVSELGLEEHVEFLGERQDIPTVIRALDVLVAPSWEEPFGRSVIEAMALETAVVATSVGGPAEYIEDGVDGMLAAPQDVDAWAAQLERLLADRSGREALAARGSVKVRRRFDRRVYVSQMLRVYESITDPDGPTADAKPPPLPRRVLFVDHQELIGGGQRSLLELMPAVAKVAQVAMACPEGPLADAAHASGVDVLTLTPSQLTFRFSKRDTPLELVHTVRARRELRRHIRRFRPDVIHANSLRAGLIAIGARRSQPVVTHCRDLLPSGIVPSLVKAFVLRGSAVVIAVSRDAARRLAGESFEQRHVVVIDNPVDIHRFDPAEVDSAAVRAELGIEGGPVLGIIAQITRWKGQTRAVRILNEVRRHHPGACLLVAGEAMFVSSATTLDNRGYEEEVRALVGELGLAGAVHFLGEREDVERVFAALDVLLVPSTEEPFGRTIIEALAMEVPVVATTGGGPREIVRLGIDGELAAPDDMAAWVAAVERQIARDGGGGSRDYAIERFNPDRHGDSVLGVYALALESARARA
jgi:glycosyltransferase involved in cell wall biosynthesis